jgi:hypothetical protein
MFTLMLWSIAAHHSEAADPDLLEWIKNRLDHLLNLDAWVVVALLGLILLSIPVSVVTLYLVQRRRYGIDPRRSSEDQS